MLRRRLGRQGPEVAALGLGCSAIGGLSWKDGRRTGWTGVDPAEAARAIRCAVDLGLTFFDTADVYGAGRSERLLGDTLGAARQDVILASKFGKLFDEEREARFDGTDASPDYIRKACEASLRRLRTDWIDLYQFHDGVYASHRIDDVVAVLERLRDEGKIRDYGWSTDLTDRARAIAGAPHCISIQHRLNLFEGNVELLRFCETAGLGSINRSPLAQGLLTGKFDRTATLPDADLRAGWDLRDGKQGRVVDAMVELREELMAGGRTPAQGAVAWLWARSSATVPITGFKTVAQVQENARALEKGPLDADSLTRIERIVDAHRLRPRPQPRWRRGLKRFVVKPARRLFG